VTGTGSGGHDHEVVDSGDRSTLLRRRLPERGGLSASAEAHLLRLVASRSPLPVPQVVRLISDDVMEMQRVPGTPLLHHLPLPSRDEVRRLALALGGFVAALSQVPRAAVKDLVPVEQPTLDEYRDEAAELSRTLHPELTVPQRRAVASFLVRLPPPSPAGLYLAHSDLGAEHVFVAGAPRQITGVIDWSDSAIGDPALDLGLIMRDLGVDGLQHALTAFVAGGGDVSGAVPRARFYARVRALEDLSFGLEQDVQAYRDNALRSIDELFLAGDAQTCP
jgi:aminoglycoside phosphotransferase (APT) family kinase protein